MAGRKQRKAKLDAEKLVQRTQAQLHRSRLKEAQDRIRQKVENGEDAGDADAEDLSFLPTIRAAIDNPDGESPRLWRTGFVKCVNPDDIPEDTVIEAVHRGHGIVSVIGRILGVSNGTLYEWIKTKRTVKDAMAETRESMVDLAECRLFEACNRGEQWAVHEVLHCLGSHRGWVDKTGQPDNRGSILEAITNMVDGEPADETLP